MGMRQERDEVIALTVKALKGKKGGLFFVMQSENGKMYLSDGIIAVGMDLENAERVFLELKIKWQGEGTYYKSGEKHDRSPNIDNLILNNTAPRDPILEITRFTWDGRRVCHTDNRVILIDESKYFPFFNKEWGQALAGNSGKIIYQESPLFHVFLSVVTYDPAELLEELSPVMDALKSTQNTL
jgi:hypothetical protein